MLPSSWLRAKLLVLGHGVQTWHKALFAWHQGSLRLVRYTVERLMQQRCAQVASSLTFTTLLSLVPLLSIVLAMLTMFHVVGDDGSVLQGMLLDNLAPDTPSVRQVVLDHIRSFAQNTSQLTTVGLISLAVTSLMTLTTIDDVFNRLWGVARARPLSQRLLLYWAILTVGPVVMGLGAYFTSLLVTGVSGVSMAPAWAPRSLVSMSAALLNVLGFTGLYMIVPNRHVRWSHAAIGGAAAGVAFEAMKRGFSLYIVHVPTYTVLYGALSVLPVFLLWVYLSWWVILSGAALTAVLPDLDGRRHDTGGAGSAWPVVLCLLVALRDAQQRGQGLSLDELAPQVGIGFAETEAWLESLLEQGWIVRTPEGRWYLALDPRRLSLRTVHNVVVLAPSNDVVGIALGPHPALDQSLFDLPSSLLQPGAYGEALVGPPAPSAGDPPSTPASGNGPDR